MDKARQRISVRTLIGGALIFCSCMTAIVAVSLQYYFARQSELKHTLEHYKTHASSVSTHLFQLHESAASTAMSGAQFVSIMASPEPSRELLIAMAQLLEQDNRLHSIFVAKDNNDFFQLISLDSADLRSRMGVLSNEAWMVVVHEGEKAQRTKVTRLYDESFQELRHYSEFSSFIPTQRNWFQNAGVTDVYNSAAYLFHTLKVSGETFSIRVPEQNAVVGVDVLLSSLEQSLKRRFVDNDGLTKFEAFIYQRDGRLIATNRNFNIVEELPLFSDVTLSQAQLELIRTAPELKVSNQDNWGPFDYSVSGEPQGFAIDLFKSISEMTGLKFRFINGRTWDELVTDFRNGNIDILHSITNDDILRDVGAKGDVLYKAPYAFLVRDNQASYTSLQSVQGKTLGLLSGWSITQKIKRAYPEIQILEFASIHDAIDALREQKIDAVLDIAPVLTAKVNEKFSQDLYLSMVQDPLLTGEFKYLVHPDKQAIFDIMKLAVDAITPAQRAQIKAKWRSKNAQPSLTYVPYKALVEYAEQARDTNQIILTQLEGEWHYLFVASLTERDEEFLAVVIPQNAIMDSINKNILYASGVTAGLLVLLMPFAWWLSKPIATPINRLTDQVSLIAQRHYDKLALEGSRVKEVNKLSLATNKMAQEIESYDQQQKAFFDSMIKLVAQAIDEKSPYTAGHCDRVPQIALMLADEAEKSQHPDFQAFQFHSDDEKREFRIAAWLHDCGKIAIPEYVVDKGTKLETNYNRIHEVRMRFEVLWRDAQIGYLLEHSAQSHDLNQALKEEYQALQAQFAFIANANVGGEFMSDEDIERLHQLAKVEWTRYFDRNIGLSPLGETRHQKVETPAKEPLLADRGDHIIERIRPFTLDPKLGITMKVPEVLYNHGELYNLSVRRGTLSEEERFKINEHMIGGIKMLDSIPFPPELSRVPRYATTHHEMMNGKGYPRSLTGDELSIPERLLAVADVFEALTAADRPYKKAKPLSVAIDIMDKMVKGGHLDEASFHLLLKSGVYRTYADQYLPEAMRDKVDIEQYLNSEEAEM